MRIRSAVFVGRRDELARLSGWLDDAAAGRPRLVVIGGEAGVGKTRLVQEFSRVAAQHGARTLIGAAADYGEGGLPFGAIAEALRPAGILVSELSGDEPAAPAVARALGEGDVDRMARMQLFERLVESLARLADDRPVVLVLEDLHWADASTREFLAFLARNLGAARLLAIATYRSDDVGREHPLRGYLLGLRRGQAELIDLARFDRAEVGEQVAAIRGAPLDDATLAALFARSQGNAFFSEELLASAAGEALPATLPPTLRDVMLARVERLSDAGRRFAAVLAVAGTADEALLTAASGLAEDTVTAVLREVIERNVVEPTTGGGYGFRHALLREAIYQDLLAGERAGLHRQIARALAARPQVEPGAGLLAQLAHHWELAGEPREAIIAAWRAAGAADRAYAQPEASRLFERVADLWPLVEDAGGLLGAELGRGGPSAAAPDRATAFWRAASSAVATDLGEGVRLARAAAGEVDAEADPDRFALLQDHIATWAREIGMPDEAAEADRQLRATIDRASAQVRARLLVSQSDAALIRGDLERARQQADEGVAAAEQSGSEPDRINALIYAARATGYGGDLAGAARMLALARGAAQAGGHGYLAAIAQKWHGDILQSAGRLEASLGPLLTAAAELAELGESIAARHTHVIAAQALHRLGRWPEAEAELVDALGPPIINWALVVAGYLYAGQGRFAEAEQQLQAAAQFVAMSGATGSYGPYHAARAEMALWRGQARVALDEVAYGMPHVEQDLRWYSELAVLGVRAAADESPADIERAAGMLAQLRQSADRLPGGTIFAPEVSAALASAEAEFSRARGEADPVLYAAAGAAWLGIPEPYPAAYALFRQAEALLPRQRKAAVEPLRQVMAIARELGARPLLDAAESLASRARIDVTVRAAGAVAGAYGLTVREREVLALLAQGRSDTEIARELFISPKTASVHVSNIKAKLGVERRIEAAAIGLKLGGTG